MIGDAVGNCNGEGDVSMMTLFSLVLDIHRNGVIMVAMMVTIYNMALIGHD